ncbi:hypothetical protein KKF55_00140, partial [Patescibacteria group bacterium]|nr:hypothetical protein [Patescibacteria group bacterium]
MGELGIGETTTETQTRSRSWERAQRLWQSAVDSYMAGGYGDPRIRNYADNVIGEPNYQRDAWINGVDTVLRGFVANIPSEPEAQGPEEDPSKPDIYSAGE